MCYILDHKDQIKVDQMLSIMAAKDLALFTKRALNEAKKFEDPVLLVALPGAIIKETISAPEEPKFDCPNRKDLHEACSKVSLFDRLTVPPVNNELHRRGIMLTKESLNALKADMDHSAQKSIFDPVGKKVVDSYKSAHYQRNIAESFANAGEHEGAFMHRVIGHAFEKKGDFLAKVTGERTNFDLNM